ncbi:MAG: Ig-like domain-containing protein [Coriobacteriales bacterium]|jgi:hypothetical protein|nr:Ig-like domain-containing protein [Coriobacteriales bacterium]
MKSRVTGKTEKLLSVLLVLALVSMVPVAPAFAGEETGGQEQAGIAGVSEDAGDEAAEAAGDAEEIGSAPAEESPEAVDTTAVPLAIEAIDGPTLEWLKNYGGGAHDYFESVTPTTDGGFVAVGYSYNVVDLAGNMRFEDAIIARFDKNGNKVWFRNYGGSSDDYFYSVTPTTDGGFVAVGYSCSSKGDLPGNKGFEDAIIAKFYGKTIPIKVTANSKNGEIVAVPGATVSLYDNSGGTITWLKDATTDANGIARIDISGMTANQMANVTASARYAIGATEISNGGRARNPLFEKFGTGSNGQPVRMVYELHSEEIDANGNWCGQSLPQTDTTLELLLKEPRILVNLAVAYMDDTSDPSYRQKVKDTMSKTSQLLAQATDGHVMLNKVLLLPVYNRLDFADTSKWESMADVQIQSTIDEQTFDWFGLKWISIKARSNAHPDGFYSDETERFVEDSGFKYLPDARNYEEKSSYQRVQMSGTEGGGWDSSKLGTHMYAETLTHELGHYLLGFYDEYIGYRWDATIGDYIEYQPRGETIHPNGNPYGLMDHQHDDIEASRLISDYSYVTGATPRKNLTVQWFLWRYSPLNQSGLVNASCEGVLGYLLDWNLSSSDDFNSPYWGAYTLAPSANSDRRAIYPYATLDDSSFKDPRYDAPFSWDGLAMAQSQYSASAQTQSVEPLAEDTTGKIYVSDTQNVIAYIDYGQGGSAQFSVDATERSNGDYFAVSEATEVTVTSTGQPLVSFTPRLPRLIP